MVLSQLCVCVKVHGCNSKVLCHCCGSDSTVVCHCPCCYIKKSVSVHGVIKKCLTVHGAESKDVCHCLGSRMKVLFRCPWFWISNVCVSVHGSDSRVANHCPWCWFESCLSLCSDLCYMYHCPWCWIKSCVTLFSKWNKGFISLLMVRNQLQVCQGSRFWFKSCKSLSMVLFQELFVTVLRSKPLAGFQSALF